MHDIPAGAAAREAWKALPDTVRAEVAALAERGEAHPDPAVAAIAVGALRHSSRLSMWGGRLLLATLIIIFGGDVLGLLMLGGRIHDGGWRDTPFLVPFVAVILAFAATGGLLKLPERLRPQPSSAAQSPNLRALLLLPQALTTPQPMTVRRHRPDLPIALAALPFAVAYGYLLARWTGRPLELLHGARQLLVIGTITTIGSAITWYTKRHERRLRRKAPMPIRFTEAGLRFGHGRTIPWTDVQGVYVTADTLEWQVRDRPRLVMDFDATSTLPEDIVLAARAYAESVSLGQRVMR